MVPAAMCCKLRAALLAAVLILAEGRRLYAETNHARGDFIASKHNAPTSEKSLGPLRSLSALLSRGIADPAQAFSPLAPTGARLRRSSPSRCENIFVARGAATAPRSFPLRAPSAARAGVSQMAAVAEATQTQSLPARIAKLLSSGTVAVIERTVCIGSYIFALVDLLTAFSYDVILGSDSWALKFFYDGYVIKLIQLYIDNYYKSFIVLIFFFINASSGKLGGSKFARFNVIQALLLNVITGLMSAMFVSFPLPPKASLAVSKFLLLGTMNLIIYSCLSIIFGQYPRVPFLSSNAWLHVQRSPSERFARGGGGQQQQRRVVYRRTKKTEIVDPNDPKWKPPKGKRR